MTPNNAENPPLTPEQEEIADALIEACELEDVKDAPLSFMGAVGSVRYGLGRCAHHLAQLEWTDQQIAELVRLKLSGQPPQPEA